MINTTNILNTLNARQTSDLHIHNDFVTTIKSCVDLSKKEIITDAGLNAVFSHPVLERKYMRQVVTWLAAHTPIRIKFKKNGQFDKLGFARNPEWDIAGLEANKWYTYEKATTKSAPKANVERALKTLALEIAREGFETGALGATINNTQATVANNLMTMVLEAMESEKFDAWCTARSAEMEAEKRKEESVAAEKSAETRAAIANARAIMQATAEADLKLAANM